MENVSAGRELQSSKPHCLHGCYRSKVLVLLQQRRCQQFHMTGTGIKKKGRKNSTFIAKIPRYGTQVHKKLIS
jgi:hypothetical protein